MKDSIYHNEYQKIIEISEGIYEETKSIEKLDDELKKNLRKLNDEIRYGVPIRNDNLKHFDVDMKYHLDEIREALKNVDNEDKVIAIKTSVKKLNIVIKDRKSAIESLQAMDSKVTNETVLEEDNTICDVCGYVYSKSLGNCPRCKKKNVNPGKKLLATVAIILAIIIAGGIGTYYYLKNYTETFLTIEEKTALVAFRHAKEQLLAPDSMELYECYVCETTDDRMAVYIYYGATNKGGGITDTSYLYFIEKDVVIDRYEMEDIESVTSDFTYYKLVRELLDGTEIDVKEIKKHL